MAATVRSSELPATDPSTPEGVRVAALAWLDAFAATVRARDFARGRTMFADDVVGFGSVTGSMVGLDDLVARQWRQVWPVTRGFDFDRQTLHVDGDADGRLVWVAAQWSSVGRDATTGREFERHGRVTIVLEPADDGSLLARHTHFSMEPPRPENESEHR